MLRTLVSGAVFNILNLIVQIFLGMLVFREMLLSFGEHDFGQWSFVFAILAHIVLFEFGLGSVISKLTPILGRDEHNQARFSAAVLVIFSIGAGFLLLIGIAALVLNQMPVILPFDDSISLAELLFLLGANFVFTFLAGALQAYLTGKFKVGRLNLIRATFNIFRAVSILLLLEYGSGVFAVAVVFALSSLIQLLLMMWASYQVGFMTEFHPSSCSKAALQYILKRGSRFVFMSVNGYARNNGAIIVCGIVIGAIALVPLRIAGRLMEIYIDVALSLTYMLTPYFSSLGETNSQTFKKSFQISLAASAFVSTAIFFNMVFIGEWFLQLWLGEVPANTFAILIALATGYCFAIAQGPSISIMIARDRNNEIMVISILETILFLGLIYPFIKLYGVIGAAYATSISIFITRVLIQPIWIIKILQLSLSSFFMPLLTTMFVTAILIAMLNKLSFWLETSFNLNGVLVFLFLQALMVALFSFFLLKKYRSKATIR